MSANYGRTDDKVSPSRKTHLLIKKHLKSRSSGIETVTCYQHATIKHFGDPSANNSPYDEHEYGSMLHGQWIL